MRWLKSKKMPKQKKERTILARSLQPIKLKDKAKRNMLRINLVKVFGFVPEEIVIQKVRGQNNKFIISAVLTPDELTKEARIKQELKIKKQIKKAKKKK